MSGTEDSSKVEHAMLEEHNMLADTELTAASGGIWFMAYARERRSDHEHRTRTDHQRTRRR
jgi:hypothetical protein